MFLAHAPAGLLLSRLFGRSRAVMLACMAGALAPDIDMLWFYVVDDGRVHHHRYWTHVPLFWAALAPLVLAVAGRHKRMVGAFLVGVLSHLLLDTIVGDIQWLQPFSSSFVHFVEVPRREGFWIWSFVLHWTFAFELAIVGAGMLFARSALAHSRLRRPFGNPCSRASSRSSS